MVRTVPCAELADAVADEVRQVRHRHHNTGLVAPIALHGLIADALDRIGLRATDRVHDLAANGSALGARLL